MEEYEKVLDWEDIFRQMSSKEVGRRISERRIAQGMSAEQLARCMGRSVSTVSRIEKGKQDINVEQLQTISHALKTNYSDLIID